MTEDNSKKDEYLDVSHNMRTYINMRFAQLTLFIAITAALLNVIYGKDNGLLQNIYIALKFGGLLSAFIFLIMEIRAADFFHHYKRRAIELEESLGYKQYTLRPEKKVFTATNAVYLLIGAVFIFWVIVLICPSF